MASWSSSAKVVHPCTESIPEWYIPVPFGPCGTSLYMLHSCGPPRYSVHPCGTPLYLIHHRYPLYPANPLHLLQISKPRQNRQSHPRLQRFLQLLPALGPGPEVGQKIQHPRLRRYMSVDA